MKRVAMMLMVAVVLVLMSYEVCPAQERAIIKIDKTITTAADTTTITEKDLLASDLYLYNNSATDTLQFHTNNETAWSSLYAGKSAHFRIYVKKLFLKAKSGSGISVTISNGEFSGNISVPNLNTLNTVVRPTWQAWSAMDSIQRPLDATVATPYAINDVYTSTTSAASMTLFAFKNVANTNGGNFKINMGRIRTDTAITTNVLCLLTLFEDSALVNHVADNAQSPMLGTGTAFKNVIGEIVFSLQATGAGTGSTTAWDVQTSVNIFGHCAAGKKDIYGKITWLTAVTYSNGGKLWIDLEGQKELLP